jgi:hypothetical protein
MKFITICLFLVNYYLISYGQSASPSVKSVKTKSISKLLGSIDSSMKIRADHFMIRLFLIANRSGSSKQAESHEISHKVLINVAEYDEYPIWHLFSAGPFLNPKFSNGNDSGDKYLLIIEHGTFDERRQTRLGIYSDRIIIE